MVVKKELFVDANKLNEDVPPHALAV